MFTIVRGGSQKITCVLYVASMMLNEYICCDVILYMIKDYVGHDAYV